MQGSKDAQDQDINELFTHERAFGPTNATNITDPEIFRKLLDPNNKIIDRFTSNRSLIIGRKGSGKTSFLRGLARNKVREYIDTAETFAKIVDSIDEKSKGFLFVEKVAQLWEHIFTLSLLRGVSQAYATPATDVAIVRDYCAENGLSGEITIEDWLWTLLRVAKDKVKSDSISSVAAVVAEIAGEDYTTARAAAIRILKAHKERAIVLVDSLEQYPVQVSSVAHAMAGLLHCVGEFNERNKWINVRLCLPAEMYHSFLDISANPLKDFSNSVTLHWHPQELLCIAANRLNIYLRQNFPKQAYGSDLIDKKHAQSFLERFLPRDITNGLGTAEGSISYILRHTQLMPRHLLRIFNSIFAEAHTSAVPTYPAVDPASVLAGIRKEEVTLAEEVCSAFHNRYPSLRRVCESVIKYLPLVFDEGELHQAFNLHGKKAFGADDFEEFKRMLMESAVVGRVLNEDDGRYVQGMFEYTAAHKLITSTADKLCLHPIFAEVFHYKSSDSDRPIYPYGTDPNADDYRDQLLWV